MGQQKPHAESIKGLRRITVEDAKQSGCQNSDGNRAKESAKLKIPQSAEHDFLCHREKEADRKKMENGIGVAHGIFDAAGRRQKLRKPGQRH